MKQKKPLNAPRARRGFSLVELLAVVAILGILAALLIPVVSRMIERSESTQSMSNLRQIASATQIFAAEYNGLLPPVTLFQQVSPDEIPSWAPDYFGPNMNWKQIIGPYIGEQEGERAWDEHSDVFRCPRWEDSDFYSPSKFWFTGYGMNSRLERPRSNRQNMIHNFGGNTSNPPMFIHTIPHPESVPLVGDAKNNFLDGSVDATRWSNGMVHIGFLNGTVRQMTLEQASSIIADPSNPVE